MRAHFIVGVENVRCAARLGNGVMICDGLRIVNDHSKATCLKDEAFRRSAGRVETSYLQRAHLLVISDSLDLPDIDRSQLITNMLDHVKSFLAAIWFLRDHSGFFDRGYLLEDSGNLHSNTQVTSYYNARGERRPIDVSRKELELAVRFSRPGAGHVADDFDVADERVVLRGRDTPSHQAVPLFDRFMGFVEYSRTSMDLPLRIAMACSALEAVFSTSSEELRHRVSERVAFLLESSPLKRHARYNLVKRLYGIRSKFLHGDAIAKKDQAELLVCSEEADKTLRSVAAHLFGNDEFSQATNEGKDALDRYHTELLFGIKKSSLCIET